MHLRLLEVVLQVVASLLCLDKFVVGELVFSRESLQILAQLGHFMLLDVQLRAHILDLRSCFAKFVLELAKFAVSLLNSTHKLVFFAAHNSQFVLNVGDGTCSLVVLLLGFV